MEAAEPQSSVPPGRPAGYLAFVALVVGLAALFAGVLLLELPADLPRLPMAFWVMAVLAVACDARPFTPVDRRRASAVFPSICFTFAILLAWGIAAAIAVQTLATVVAGWRLRYGPGRIAFAGAQYTWALAAAYIVISLAPDEGFGPGQQPGWPQVAAVAAGAAVWFSMRYTLISAARRLRDATGWWSGTGPGFTVELLSVSSLLLLGPVLVAAAQVSAALIPLVLVPLYAVHRMARLAVEQERLACLDPLTGLANRKALLAEVAEQLARHDRPTGHQACGPPPAAGERVALLLLDLDRFKHVNDALGHAVGDRLLVEVGDRLTAAVRPRDLVARLGGDEFAIVASRLPDIAAARQLAERVVDALAEPVSLDGLPLDVGGSIGIALYPDHGADFATLMRHADVAMYDAKQRGATVSVYAPESDQNSAERLGLLADLRQVLEETEADSGTPGSGAPVEPVFAGGAAALVRLGPDALTGAAPTGAAPGTRAGTAVDSGAAAKAGAAAGVAGEITLYYQPQIAIATGEVVGVEALLRWRHPRRGMVSPDELIRVAEHSPVMRLLTRRVIDDVVEQLAKWSAAGLRLRASLNVSVRDLHTGEIADQVGHRLAQHGVPPHQLQMEITEGALMADPRRVLNTISRLDRIGVAISLDDFGTGYSSMQHLRRLPLTEVKIDRSFVLNMAVDADDAAIVRSVIELAGALGLRVVAEGVEDERTWRLLHTAGCGVAQGWFYARPMPADELVSWLARYRPLIPAAQPGATGRHREDGTGWRAADGQADTPGRGGAGVRPAGPK